MEERVALTEQYVSKKSDLKKIAFSDGIARVDVPAHLLKKIRFKNHQRQPSPRLLRLTRAIRDNGYSSFDPIIARIGQKGRWIIVDGGHRLTAAQIVAGEFWSNLFGRKVWVLPFLLFETPRSWAKVKTIAQYSRSADAPALPESVDAFTDDED